MLPFFPVEFLPVPLPALNLGPSAGKGLFPAGLFLIKSAEEMQRRKEIPSHDQLPASKTIAQYGEEFFFARVPLMGKNYSMEKRQFSSKYLPPG